MDGSQPIPDFIALCLTFIALIIGIWLAVSQLHKRPFLTLITPYPTMRWHRFWQGFKWQIAFFILSAGIEELIYPGTYHYSLDPSQFYKFAILVCCSFHFKPPQKNFSFADISYRHWVISSATHWCSSCSTASVLWPFMVAIPK